MTLSIKTLSNTAKLTCLIAKPRAAISPEVTVQARRTAPLEGASLVTKLSSLFSFTKAKSSLMVSFFKGTLSFTPLLSLNEMLLLSNFTSLCCSLILFSFLADFRPAKATILPPNSYFTRSKLKHIRTTDPSRIIIPKSRLKF